MSYKILIMAGGTGGHIFPGLSVAEALKQQGWHIHWLGTEARMEADIVPEAGIDISFLDVAGVRGNGILRLLAAPLRIMKSIFQARKVIAQFQPDVVLGMGGFASGPGGIAAWSQGVPLILHEQNAIPGLTNKILSRFATQVLTGFENTFTQQIKGNSRFQWVGNPVRQGFSTVYKSTASVRLPVNILVVGGSLGARALNHALPEALKGLSGEQYVVRHQSGAGNHQEVEGVYQQQQIKSVQVEEFIQDMAAAYQWADLVICRAGALTVAEVAMAGVAAIFVPLPTAVDDHQTKNAQVLKNVSGALVIPQSRLTEDLARELEKLINNSEILTDMAHQAKTVARVDALDKVVEQCQRLAGAQ